ncbi:urease accessory protein UreD [Rhodococcus sp. CH91]|uniref:urease accessory protein UreD n=1 Tax=Rhodococcus sp. CH91 TaxID=2910256 RepID=UPI001F4B1847|nr:urease accessory protein UreD [Rhodococcus sp. CH91]
MGVLQLGFERNPARNRTELVHHYQKSPLQIMRPLYFDPLRPDVPYTYVMSSGGGVLQADRLRTDLTFGAGTSAHVTTQAQTRVYRMDNDYASSVTHITAGSDAYVEYLPDAVIPFAGSRLYQHTSVTLDESASLLLAETVYAGRLARNERHRYDVYASDLEVRRPDGRLVALDRVRLRPGGTNDRPAAEELGVLAEHDILAMLYVFTPRVRAADLTDLLHDALSTTFDDGLFGISALPNDAGVWMRLLANDPVSVARANHAAAAAAHEMLTGTAAPAIRKT